MHEVAAWSSHFLRLTTLTIIAKMKLDGAHLERRITLKIWDKILFVFNPNEVISQLPTVLECFWLSLLVKKQSTLGVPKFDAQPSVEPLSRRGTYFAWTQPLESPGHGSQVFPTVPVCQNESKMEGYPGFLNQQSLAILGPLILDIPTWPRVLTSCSQCDIPLRSSCIT